MPATQAFATYESLRNRLPILKRTNIESQSIDTILDVADQFDTFFFDAFGVLNVGNHAIKNAPQVIQTLKNMGKRCLIVSNAAAFEKERQIQKFNRLGYPFDGMHIVTSRDALLEGIAKYDPNMVWGSIGATDGQSDIAKMKLNIIHQTEQNFYDVDGFLFLSSHLWDDKRQQEWIEMISNQPKPILLGNPDIIAPQGDHISIEAGHYIFALDHILFEQTHVFGKPFPDIYETAQNRTLHLYGSFDPERTLMIGDTLHTDILGGNAFGLKTALITGHGFLKDLNADLYIQQSNIYPDYILESI